MIWGAVQLSKTCLATGKRDPKKNPGERFFYVDISAIDRSLKVITFAPEILGADAPSRAKKEIREGDVLVSTVRPNLNAVAVVSPDLDGHIASTGFCVLRPNKSAIVGKYLFYFTTTPTFINILSGKVRGAHYPAVSDRDVKEINIPLPPLSEQRRIVEILDQADTLRKKRAEADAKATRLLPALFYELFGDPATNPMGWPVRRIRDLVSPIERRDPGQQPESTFIYIDIAGIDGQFGTIVETKELLGAEAPSRARQIVRKNDVIISTVRPYLRATSLVPDHLDNQICSTGFCVLRAQEGQGFGFLYALSRLHWFTDRLNARARGASYPAVTDGDILNLPIPCPAQIKAHETFDAQILDVLSMQHKRELSAAAIEKLFASLLHSAFKGNLTVKWREAHMKELLAEMEAQAKALKI